MKYLRLLLLMPFVACSNTADISGIKRGGTVKFGTELNQAAALKKASEQCRKYNLVASVTRIDPVRHTMTFVCDVLYPEVGAL